MKLERVLWHITPTAAACLPPWVPADPHSEFKPLLEFQSPCVGPGAFSNKWMHLVCLWVLSNHDLTTVPPRLDIGHFYLRPDRTARGKGFLVLLIGLLEVHSS